MVGSGGESQRTDCKQTKIKFSSVHLGQRKVNGGWEKQDGQFLSGEQIKFAVFLAFSTESILVMHVLQPRSKPA